MAILARIAYASGVDTPTLLALRFAIAAAAMLAIALVAPDTAAPWRRRSARSCCWAR